MVLKSLNKTNRNVKENGNDARKKKIAEAVYIFVAAF